jgi:hypothetical protein
MIGELERVSKEQVAYIKVISLNSLGGAENSMKKPLSGESMSNSKFERNISQTQRGLVTGFTGWANVFCTRAEKTLACRGRPWILHQLVIWICRISEIPRKIGAQLRRR